MDGIGGEQIGERRTRLAVAVLVKQVPRFEEMELGEDGRLRREGVDLELNPYCRRAVAQGVALARATGGTCTVVSLGPPPAEDCLREALAWGADTGILVTDPAFGGGDTLATSTALAAVLGGLPALDLVLAGRNSVDSETGQVPPQIAELLGLPFLGGVRELRVSAGRVHARCEHDDGWAVAEVALPVVLSCAERLCEPAKVDAAGRSGVAADRIRHVNAAAVGAGPWGQAGSPTRVGVVRRLALDRLRIVLAGEVQSQVRRAVDLMHERGAGGGGRDQALAPLPRADIATTAPVVGVLAEPARRRTTRELLGAAARLASELGGSVTALGNQPPDPAEAGAWGADAVVRFQGVDVEEDVAHAAAAWCAAAPPWAILAPSTMWGREVSARVAAGTRSGLVGDAVDLDVANGRLVAWKPAFGGGLVAAVTSSTAIQMATVRPGALALRTPRLVTAEERFWPWVSRSRVRVDQRTRDDDVDVLATARAIVVVGLGVAPDAYPALAPLLDMLGAEMAGTRKVTDRGWLPRSRQIGLTGRAVAPAVVVEVATSGRFNHSVGLRGAGFVLAINSDPAAPVFGCADAGIVGDWALVVPHLVEAIASQRAVA